MIKKVWLSVGILTCCLLIGGLLYDLNDNNLKKDIGSFNAVANDKIDDTENIQKAIDSLNGKEGEIVFPKGIYLINAGNSIKLKNNVTLSFEKGTVFKALPNELAAYEIFEIHDVKNVKLLGSFRIIGDRKEHQGDTGEWGFGISIRGSENIYIENSIIEDCWGDGIYIGASPNKNFNKNIVLKRPVLKSNRRQGISIISAIDLKIINPVITDTNGKAPESGIDLEPNNSAERLENIQILNPETENNKGYGILIYLKYLKNSEHPVSILIDDDKKVYDEIRIVKPAEVKGDIKIVKVY
ncbi:right-handed parallel beta-helix repeat-containing protein [Mesobacillus foraminis]|uniref:right-handed parallel beta-helix repeat-containing protein n=1 Tax=Mesobacillus foraminis TaxID=279826 RepID=UPI00399F3952